MPEPGALLGVAVDSFCAESMSDECQHLRARQQRCPARQLSQQQAGHRVELPDVLAIPAKGAMPVKTRRRRGAESAAHSREAVRSAYTGGHVQGIASAAHNNGNSGISIQIVRPEAFLSATVSRNI